MASWLSDLRPQDAPPDAPAFPSTTGTALNYANVYNRVFRPALIAAGIAVKTGEDDKGGPTYDYCTNGRAFHAFRHACGSLLHAEGRRGVQVQGWLRHSQLSTTQNTYTHTVDEGLGSAAVWDEILPVSAVRGNVGATQHPQTAANGRSATTHETASEKQIG